MMVENFSKEIEKSMYTAIEVSNESQERNFKLKKDMQEIITGDQSKLDSVGLINFLLSLEEILVNNSIKSPNLFNYIEKSNKDLILKDIFKHICEENNYD